MRSTSNNRTSMYAASHNNLFVPRARRDYAYELASTISDSDIREHALRFVGGGNRARVEAFIGRMTAAAH